MKTIGAILAAACVLFLAAQAASAQNSSDQGVRVKSAWVRATVSGEGQPKGYVPYQDYCSMCHGEGPGRPGTMALQAKYQGAVPALLADRTDLTPQLIKMYVRNGISIMPIFRKTEISDADLDAIVAYLTRNNKK
jgi:(+)-pinoresinol hydroxylase